MKPEDRPDSLEIWKELAVEAGDIVWLLAPIVCTRMELKNEVRRAENENES